MGGRSLEPATWAASDAFYERLARSFIAAGRARQAELLTAILSDPCWDDPHRTPAEIARSQCPVMAELADRYDRFRAFPPSKPSED